MSLQKGLKDVGMDKSMVAATKEKERSSGKQESKARHPHNHHPQSQHLHPHQSLHHSQHPSPMEDLNNLERHKSSLLMEYKDYSHSLGKPLSACLLNGKMTNGDSRGGAGSGHGVGSKASAPSCGGEPMARRQGDSVNAQARHLGNNSTGHCTKEAVSGEMRISEQPLPDCIERGQVLHQSLSYSVPPPMTMTSTSSGGHPGGFHCLQLHTGHPHNPHHSQHPHHSHHSHHHPDFFCPPAPIHDKGVTNNGARDPKTTRPTYVPSPGHLVDKALGPFQLGNSECQGVAGVGGNSKDKAIEKANGGVGHPGNWHRKQPEQQHQQQQQAPPQKQHPYRKAEKAPDWMHNHEHHLQQQQQQQQLQHQQNHTQQHQAVRSHSADCISAREVDVFRPSLGQDPKTGHSLTHSNNINTQPYRDCSHSGQAPNSSPLASKTMSQGPQGPGGGSCSMHRDGQKVARIRHQQHGRAPSGSAASSAELGQTNEVEMKRKMDMSPYGYGNNGQHHSHQQQSVPPWTVHPNHIHLEEDQHKAYMESVNGPANRQQPHQHQSTGMIPPVHVQNQPEVLTQQGEGSAMKSLLKYSNQHQPLISQKTPFGGLGSLKTGPNCTMQSGKSPLPSRKGLVSESDRPDCGGRSREMGDAPNGEGEVRQPPVGIAVAVARQREPVCRPPDSHPSSCQGRVHSSMKGKQTFQPLSRWFNKQKQKCTSCWSGTWKTWLITNINNSVCQGLKWKQTFSCSVV